MRVFFTVMVVLLYCSYAVEASHLKLPLTSVLSIRGGKSISKGKDVKRATKSRTRSKATVPRAKSKKRGLFMRLVEALSGILFPGGGTGNKGGKASADKFKRSSSRKGKSAKEMSQAHLEKSFREGDANARIQKELRAFVSNPPEGCKLAVGANLRVWVMTITGVEGTIYAGEKYKLKFVFPKEYPTRPPGVYFLKPTPKHMHVYSNGDICLNLLGRDWRPNMTAQTLAISILSMLSNAKEKKIPVDNAMHADNPPGQSQDNWMYHDDTC